MPPLGARLRRLPGHGRYEVPLNIMSSIGTNEDTVDAWSQDARTRLRSEESPSTLLGCAKTRSRAPRELRLIVHLPSVRVCWCLEAGGTHPHGCCLPRRLTRSRQITKSPLMHTFRKNNRNASRRAPNPISQEVMKQDPWICNTPGNSRKVSGALH